MNRIQLEEEQEQLEQDSKKLDTRKKCENCEMHDSCMMEEYASKIAGIFVLNCNWHCSLHTMKDKE